MEAPGVGEVSAERRDSTTAETTHIPRTWQLFLLLVCAALALSWYQRDFIMTREVYHHLFGDRVGAERIDDHFDQLRQTAKWGYLAVPVFVGLRVGFVAILVQLYALLVLQELRLSLLFRAACWAYPALLYGMLVRTIVLARVGADRIEIPDLSFVPGSVSAFLLDASEYRSWMYNLLNFFNPSEVLWCAALYIALRTAGRLGSPLRIGLVLAVWSTTTLLQWGTTMFLVTIR